MPGASLYFFWQSMLCHLIITYKSRIFITDKRKVKIQVRKSLRIRLITQFFPAPGGLSFMCSVICLIVQPVNGQPCEGEPAGGEEQRLPLCYYLNEQVSDQYVHGKPSHTECHCHAVIRMLFLSWNQVPNIFDDFGSTKLLYLITQQILLGGKEGRIRTTSNIRVNQFASGGTMSGKSKAC